MRKITFFLSLTFFISSCGNQSAPSDLSEKQNSNETKEQTSADTVHFAVPTKLILTGNFLPGQTEGFVKVPEEMSSKPMFVQEAVLAAFINMREAALKEGVNLYIVSGTRTFSDQKAIWERKWSALTATNKDSLSVAQEILQFSSMPGTSRHHWGTDIDLVSVDPTYFESKEGDKIYIWLVSHASEFGFCQVYSNKEETGRRGYSAEKWHWSFMPISSKYLIVYKEEISYNDIRGFIGDRLAERLKIKEVYVEGIDPKCMY